VRENFCQVGDGGANEDNAFLTLTLLPPFSSKQVKPPIRSFQLPFQLQWRHRRSRQRTPSHRFTEHFNCNGAITISKRGPPFHLIAVSNSCSRHRIKIQQALHFGLENSVLKVSQSPYREPKFISSSAENTFFLLLRWDSSLTLEKDLL
jgi:hypothetical protein